MHKTIRPREILRRRRRRLAAVTLTLLLSVAAYLVYWWFANREWVATDDAFVTGHLITLKAQTEGTVVEILAENTQRVRQGQVLVRLDGVRAQLDFEKAQAELGETVRHLEKLTAGIQTLRQRIAARQAALNQVRHDLNRYLAAFSDGAASEQQVQNARDKIEELEAAIKEAEAEKTGIEAEVGGVDVDKHPLVEKAKSQLRLAYLEYKRRHILAPASGYVAKRRAEVGDQIKPGAPLLVIVPLDDLWIEANYLENQIAGIRPGQPAEIRVDAYGDRLVYHGRVQGINPGTGSPFALLPTDNATGNFIHIAERVPVRIGLDPEELRKNPLQPGLSTLTRIKTSEKGDALLASHTETQGEAYRTDIYEHELDDAEQLIEKIVLSNRFGKP
ncbi:MULTISPECIES: efflux RND transporter periplasmic adaptor subunit [Methylomicrobium]|uniref:Multidrug resistance efflux pump n=1 Tax=Methylomicrobium album BG8 TaxID=686340 RepID=H8GN98_METAL|nr:MULTISPECIES: efflux RND transporter periplasmic adaptor subunit [Methylomicrobium]EIC28327.1 multidrug resistance efflux pump [Methylomicrobium album BG8]